jgi:hypothetical protein
MTRDDIVRMALEALWPKQQILNDLPEISRFAALVAAAEREACAEICDRFQARNVGMQPAECAAAIRARGQK